MKYYEIVLLIHPDQSEQVNNIVTSYKKFICKNKGSISKFEDWGRRPLAYPIKKIHKAYYVLMNICLEKNQNIILDLETKFRINESIIRYIILHTKTNRTIISSILKSKDEHQENRSNLLKKI
ncbi:30S ribosomal protein S6 [Enterobacteriaceae endosymbiont of Neohaemonia nigricornis]|uniref:30S ribosomal protein S6 n=1 Tax=Enterobacteriaceae endosymbiont of Neohaemonia nigricornis TaxID=2675792 RepID=UPI001448FA11|nr:30S ribosomal protein S6 [Enterobacteriaceae endosymbiont of Neohaemonia nigricornis]QJC30521.1 30S ribosomal protein S6 [Enterobacteriaceae endosymbiont of Neohaemonia nigricornis]